MSIFIAGFPLHILDQRPSHYISSLNSSLNHLNKDKDESSSMSHQSHPESMDSFTTTNTTSISNHPKEGTSTPMFKHSNNVFYNQSAFQEMLSQQSALYPWSKGGVRLLDGYFIRIPYGAE